MESLSRRTALKSGAALAATATLGFPALAKGDDGELLARVADFWTAYEDSERKSEISTICYDKLHAMPDFPEYPVPLPCDPEKEKWEAAYSRCADASGYHPAHEISGAAIRKAGAAANAVFSIPARTLRGCHEKAKIARRAICTDWTWDDGDEDLACYQKGSLWIDNALADLDRMAGAA